MFVEKSTILTIVELLKKMLNQESVIVQTEHIESEMI